MSAPTLADLAHANDMLRARLLDLERRVDRFESPTVPTFTISEYGNGLTPTVLTPTAAPEAA